ncbi:hypothetical protein ABW20_dc0107770 [Dactylellina cionopaga]|nr:hypothetical protein ABW20_dc0107770 [Dactylellina cionopaga]
MYRFITYLFFLIAVVSAGTTLKFDNAYKKNSNKPLANFACSDGARGFLTKYKNPRLTTNQLASKLKPGVFLAASPAVAGWGSPKCGSCFKVRYSTKSILYVVIDHAAPAVVIGPDGFTAFAAVSKGALQVSVTEMPASSCFK